MQQSLLRFKPGVLFAVAILSMGVGLAQTDPRKAPVPPAAIGEVFPVSVFADLNVAPDANAKIDLADTVGQKPTVLFYWIAGHPRADTIFQEVQKELEGTDVVLYGVVVPQPGRDAPAIRKRAKELGIHVPILDDGAFRLGQQLQVQSVPNITILDAEGRLRLTNGASLVQAIGYELTVADALDRVARTGKLGSYGYLEPYYPVTEMVGRKCPDFKAPLISNSVEQNWSSMISPEKLNVLIFWSVDCPHCRKSLPEINAWLKENSEGLNVISAAAITSEATKIRTREYCQTNEFVFPTLVDDMQISKLYNVTMTPTILIIRPDGVVDSVVLNSSDFGHTVEEKKRQLL